MQNKVTEEWASPEEKMSNDAFVLERRTKLRQLGITASTDVYNPITESYATITFADEILANEYAKFIVELAAKYNKQIVNLNVH